MYIWKNGRVYEIFFYINHKKHRNQSIHTRSAKKYREIWISAGYVYSIFDFFVALRRYSCFLFMPTSTAILNVQLIFDSCFACTCFGSPSIFAYSKKWIKESVSNFVWKTELSAGRHYEGAEHDHKKWFFEVLQRLEKNVGTSV